MNAIFRSLIIQNIKKNLKEGNVSETPEYIEKELKKQQISVIRTTKNFIFIFLAVVSASFGLKGFLLPNSFIDGGVTGISLIITELTGVSLSVFLVLINIPFIFLGFSTIGKQFALRSIFSISLLAIVVHFVDYPTITNDKLLISVFGGFFLGAGIGLAIRGGSVIDGTEVLAIFISKKTSLTIGDVILIFNILIFGIGASVFSIEIAMYAMLTYLSASKTVDFIIDGIEEYYGVSIISDQSEEIRQVIIDKLGRGCTIYKGKKGYARPNEKLKDTDIVYTLITRLEMSKLQTEIDKIDSSAFIVMSSVKDVKGGMIKKRPLHEKK